MRRVLIGATGAIVAATLVAGLGSTPAAAAPKRSVVAAFYPIAYAGQQVGGVRGDGVEPHSGRRGAARPRALPRGRWIGCSTPTPCS